MTFLINMALASNYEKYKMKLKGRVFSSSIKSHEEFRQSYSIYVIAYEY